jgi:hypothetical protein
MHFLRTKTEEITGLQDFIGSVSGNPLTQGIVVDLNPLWFYAYRVSQAGLEPKKFVGEPVLLYHTAAIELIQGSDSFIEFDWNDPSVDTYCQNTFGRNFGANNRYLVKVVAFPVISLNHLEARRTLVQSARHAGCIFRRPLRDS